MPSGWEEAERCDGGRLLMLSQPWQPWGRTEAVASGAWCSIPRCPALCRGHLGCLLLLCGAVLYCICISYLQKWVCVYTKKGPDSHLPKAWLVSTWQDLQGRVASFAKPNDAFGILSFGSCISAGDADHRFPGVEMCCVSRSLGSQRRG